VSPVSRSAGFRRSVLLSWLAALACIVVAAVALQVSEPPSDRTQTVTGVRNEPVPYGDGSVTVGGVRVGQGVDHFGGVSRTVGMFVTVDVTLSAEGDRVLSLGQFQLLSGDRVYDDYSVAGLRVQPGFAERTTVAFEVDPQRIDDLVLQVGRGEVVSGYHQQLRVHLGITPENADAWRRASVGQVLDDGSNTTWALP
jgi:hypothetical protein